ncbi:hypothetical protein ZWY2020_043442 [Hordeum vulgare]|nr:hypothetical protein ZWY2020_043442 [Hordeum vulgare]
MEVAGSPHVPFVPRDANATDSKNAKDVLDLWRQQKQIPAPFIWPHADARPSSILELDVPVVDIGAALHSAAGMARAAVQVAEACASHGFFQVTGHGVDPRWPKQRSTAQRTSSACRSPPSSAPADPQGPSKVRLRPPTASPPSFPGRRLSPSSTTTSTRTSAPAQAVTSHHTPKLRAGVSLGLGRGYYRDFFADGSSIMRCNYYPRCPEPDRTLGTGPHCDPSALTILLQDGEVDGLQVLVDGAWRSVRPKPSELVVNIGDTFMALSNGRYKSCLHRAVVHREKERRSLAYFLAPQEDRVVRPPPSPAPAPRLYPDFTWAELMRFTQRHYRADARTLDAFACWLDLPSCPATPQAQGTV